MADATARLARVGQMVAFDSPARRAVVLGAELGLVLGTVAAGLIRPVWPACPGPALPRAAWRAVPGAVAVAGTPDVTMGLRAHRQIGSLCSPGLNGPTHQMEKFSELRSAVTGPMIETGPGRQRRAALVRRTRIMPLPSDRERLPHQAVRDDRQDRIGLLRCGADRTGLS